MEMLHAWYASGLLMEMLHAWYASGLLIEVLYLLVCTPSEDYTCREDAACCGSVLMSGAVSRVCIRPTRMIAL